MITYTRSCLENFAPDLLSQATNLSQIGIERLFKTAKCIEQEDLTVLEQSLADSLNRLSSVGSSYHPSQSHQEEVLYDYQHKSTLLGGLRNFKALVENMRRRDALLEFGKSFAFVLPFAMIPVALIILPPNRKAS